MIIITCFTETFRNFQSQCIISAVNLQVFVTIGHRSWQMHLIHLARDYIIEIFKDHVKI